MVRFLSLDAINEISTNVYRSAGELPDYFVCDKSPIETSPGTADYFALLKMGWEWTFEHLRAFQPKAYAVMLESHPALLVGERFWPDQLDPKRIHWRVDGFLRLGERYIRIHPYLRDRNLEQLMERHELYCRYVALPEPIAKAYYARMCGLEVIHRLPGSPMQSRILPATIDRWTRADDFCSKGRKARDIMRAALQSVADPAVVTKGHPAETFWVMLDTREQDNYDRPGDALLVQEDSTSQRIFHIRDGAFDKLRLVTDPVTLLDDYVSWVFRCGEGAFDFMPYSEPV